LDRDAFAQALIRTLNMRQTLSALSFRATGSRGCAPDDRLDEAIHGSASPFFTSPRCGERSRASCERVRGTLERLGVADSPPHPDTSLRSVLDLSPQAGRGEPPASLVATPPRSRGGHAPEFCCTSRHLKIRGRRECRALNAPAASHAKIKKHTSIVTTVTPGHPAFPAQWF
jgi:hypothetical protein